jgi:uridine kinase
MRGKTPFIVAITGGSGSGKTTTAGQLIDLLKPLRADLISQDDYYKDSRALPDFDPATYDFDTPSARDHTLLAQHLADLRAGKSIDVPVYDFTIHGRRDATHALIPGDVIILEGTHTLCDPLIFELCDLKVYVDTPDDIRLLRRLLRDIHERGRTPETVANQYLATVRPAYERWTGPSRLNADLIVSGGLGVKGPKSETAFGAAAQIAAAIGKALNGDANGSSKIGSL